MIKVKGEATLLTAESKPYEFEGKSGVSNKARFLISNEIYKIKVTESDVKKFLELLKDTDGVSGVIELSFASPSERLTVQLDSFEPS